MCILFILKAEDKVNYLLPFKKITFQSSNCEKLLKYILLSN